MSSTAGFAVIYRWHLHPDLVVQFQQAWARGTEAIARERGGLGSRLHQADDGSWLAYAQWPDRASWERSRQLGSVNPEDTALMQAAIAESFEPLLLQPVSDLLR